MSDTLDKVKLVVAEQLDCEEVKVVEEANFQSDLGADSLDVVELVMALEEEFDVEISDETAERFATVGDVVSYIDTQA